MKKIFKLLLLITINCVGFGLGYVLSDWLIFHKFSAFQRKEFLFFSCFFLIYVYSNIFQLKTWPLYSAKPTINKNIELLDVYNDNKQLTKPKKVKLNPIIGIANFILGVLSIMLGLILAYDIYEHPSDIWFKILIVSGILFFGIGFFVDMVIVWKMNKKLNNL